MLASVASMIDQFNMPNIRLMDTHPHSAIIQLLHIFLPSATSVDLFLTIYLVGESILCRAYTMSCITFSIELLCIPIIVYSP